MKCIKNGKLKCNPKFCYTVNGSCYKQKTSGLPCTLESKRSKSTVPLIVNEEYLLFGPEKEVNETINFLKSTETNDISNVIVKTEFDTKLNGLKTPELVSMTDYLLDTMLINQK